VLGLPVRRLVELALLELVVGGDVCGGHLLHLVDDLVEAVEGLVVEDNEGAEMLHGDLLDSISEHEQGFAGLADGSGAEAEDGVDHVGQPAEDTVVVRARWDVLPVLVGLMVKTAEDI
jgi:hypothetical protein